MIFESHAHLLSHKYDEDRDMVIQNAFDNGIGAVVNVSDDLNTSIQAVEFSKKYDNIFCSAGIHPHNGMSFKDTGLDILATLASDLKTVAIGEIGLDYHYDFCDREIQKEILKKQLQLALDLDLPVILHDREAHKDMLDILKGFKGKIRGVMHCYSGSAESAKLHLKLGMHISFAGVITFKNARKAIEALEEVPIDRLLVETDSPYLAPEPKRGRRNEPAYIVYVAKKMAELKRVPYDTLLPVLWNNTFDLFYKAKPYKKQIERHG